MSLFQRGGSRPLAASIVLCLLTVGCGKQPAADAPQTHPVVGKVMKDGQPMTAGLVEFQPTDAVGERANGEIQPDGSFALTTLVDLEKIPGAKAGKYKVTIIPPIPADQNVQIFNLPQVYTVEAKDNHFDLRVGK